MNHYTTRLIETAREILRAFGYFVDNLWHVDDVHFIVEQLGLPEITDEEAMKVFALANQQFDGEHGISWPQLEVVLHHYFLREKALACLSESSPS